jgi:hypothetical protein
MTTSNELLEAIDAGDVDKIQSTFNTIMSSKIKENVDEIKKEVAKELFTGEK